MKVVSLRALVLVVAALFVSSVVYAEQTPPKVLLYHSFDGAVEKVDYSASPIEVTANKEFKTKTPAISGKAAWFDKRDPEASLLIDMKDLLKGDSWTISLWEIIDIKDWLSAPQDNLLVLLDADGEPVIRLTKSGDVLVYEDGKEIHQQCFDALYWVKYSREHLTLTWDADDSGVKSPAGILRGFWKARPYAALAIDLKRKPVYLEIGHATSGYGVDDLYVFDTALPLRSIWELMRRKDGKDIKGLEKMLAERGEIEAQRPTAIRTADWAEKMRSGIVVEAESNPGENKVVVCPVPNKDGEKRLSAQTGAAVASASAHVEPKGGPLTFKVNIKEAGNYSLALRYCLSRHMHPLWPQNSTAKTPWTDNYAQVEVKLDRKKKPIGKKPERLYPTGLFNDHAGDVEMWAWHSLNSGKKIKLSSGNHTVTVSFKSGLARPMYDALLVTKEPGVAPPHPRWADLYRIPPAWWIDGHKTEVKRGKRIDTYDVLLRNRCDEPYSCEIIAGPDRLEQQKVGVRAKPGDPIAPTCSVSLKPFENKSFQVVFETPKRLTGISDWANIYLWNDDVALRQKYRLWNVIADPVKAAKPHPRLVRVPDPKMQAEYREWMKTRDEKKMSPQLRNFVCGPRAEVTRMGGDPEWFAGYMLAPRLNLVDAWMNMSAEEIEQFLPDGPSESNGYGNDWDRVGIAYGGSYNTLPTVTKLEPEGDIDFVTSVTMEGKPRKGETEPYKKVYTAANDVDVLCAIRDCRWSSMISDHIGAAPYKDTNITRNRQAGVNMVIDAYYISGDPAHARKAFEMLKTIAWKYTFYTKHHNFEIHREDRDWWGARMGARYQFKTGARRYHAIGLQGLDVLWHALTPEERTLIEHNIVRWGMYEGMAGPLWERPSFYAAVNREDLPFLPMGKVLDDPAPVDELDFYFELFKDILHPDGISICSITGYGSVGGYATFMQKMEKYGFNIKNDPALKNLFHAQPSFTFSGGGLPTIGDGGGVNLQGYGAGGGCANAAQYAWARKLFGDPVLDEWPKLIHAAGNTGPPAKKMEGMRKQYLESDLPIEKLWPPVYIAPITGLAILRNWVPAEPIDWVEVLFDYGKFGGRCHGHAAKLATIPSFNGQIVSMDYGYGLVGQPVGSGFHMRSYAHNVVIADRGSQFYATSPVQVGLLRESHNEKALQWIDADSTRIYDDIYMRRTVFTTDFGVVDLYLCRADKEHEYDWMFHSFGVAGTDAKVKPAPNLGKDCPISFGSNPRSAITKNTVRVTWKNGPITKPPKKSNTALLHETAFVRVHALPSGTTEVGLFGIPITENCGSEIDYMMLRRENVASTVFATIQEPWRESTGPKVKSLKQLKVKAGKKTVADSEAYALEVTRMDGGKEVFFANYTDTPKTIGKVTTDAGVAFWKLDKKGRASDSRHTQGAAFTAR